MPLFLVSITFSTVNGSKSQNLNLRLKSDLMFGNSVPVVAQVTLRH